MTVLDANTIACALNISARSVRRISDRDNWICSDILVRGGYKRVYNLSDLPTDIQAKVTIHLINTGALVPATEPLQPKEKPSAKPRSAEYNPETLWAWYDSRPESVKAEGTRRAGICLKVAALLDSGLSVRSALAAVAKSEEIAEATLRRWWYGNANILGAANVARCDYAAALAPRLAGCQVSAEISPEAWDYIKADYLRPEKPALAAVYRRAQYAAAKHNWVLPSRATVERRLQALPWQVVCLAREGEDAFKRRLPHITRIKSSLHALEAVNADGHTFDLMVQLPSGDVGRPVIVGWQDLFSGKILSYRLGETLNQHIVRLSFGDLVDAWGIPYHVFLDNGREFANKWLSGQLKHRFRFVIKEDEPEGIFKTLGADVHWTTPYHGQSKPIEKAWKDLCCDSIAKHPRLAGAYTGNNPVNKPANYGQRVLDWDEFAEVVAECVAEHNARQGRRTETARGRSFDESFADSYSVSTIRKATEEQKRLWLLAAEGVTVRQHGHVSILNNLYWCEEAGSLVGKKVVVRFDSDDLSKNIHVYKLTGEYIGEASCKQANFIDAQAAKDHSRANRTRLKAAKTQLDAERKMSAIEAAQRLPNVVIPLEKPKPGAIAPMFQRTKKVANGGDLLLDDDELRPEDQYQLTMLNAWSKKLAVSDE